MSARSVRSEVEDMDNLSKVLENKQRVEEKLRQLQSYYRGRHWKDKQMCQLNSPAQFNSCF